MSHEELLNQTEESLIALGVTKGAARKLSKCIGKLSERDVTLQDIIKTLESGDIADLRKLMCELEDVIRSPIVLDGEYDGQNMVETIVVCLTKLCSQLLLSPNTDQRTGKFVYA